MKTHTIYVLSNTLKNLFFRNFDFGFFSKRFVSEPLDFIGAGKALVTPYAVQTPKSTLKTVECGPKKCQK